MWVTLNCKSDTGPAALVKRNEVMKTKIIKFTNEARCPCGGMIAYGATFTKRLPLGFGFAGTKFQIDVAEIKGFIGECMDCDQKFEAEKTRRLVTKFPRGINAKLAQARMGVAA